MTISRGKFITLEGGEGTGKSTQIRRLLDALAAAGIDVIATREPGGTPEAEKIRNLLVQRDGADFSPLTEAMMMMAARHEHIVRKIRPALEKGTWVVCDRFADSTRAYQGYGAGVPLDTIDALYDLVSTGLDPDLTFVLDIDPEVGLSRSNRQLNDTQDATEKTEDRFERKGLMYHQRLRQGFLEIARHASHRCVIIDANNDIDAIHARIIAEISARLMPGQPEQEAHA